MWHIFKIENASYLLHILMKQKRPNLQNIRKHHILYNCTMIYKYAAYTHFSYLLNIFKYIEFAEKHGNKHLSQSSITFFLYAVRRMSLDSWTPSCPSLSNIVFQRRMSSFFSKEPTASLRVDLQLQP